MGFGKDGKGVIIREDVLLTAGGLAAISAVKSTEGITLQTTSFRVIKTTYFVVVRGSFGAEGDEVIIGIADGTLSTAQIAEVMNNNGPADRNAMVSAAIADRAVWPLVQIKEPADSATSYPLPVNNGMPMEKSLRWTFTPTEGWDWFLFNPLAGALTTGLVVAIFATHFGVWVD